MKLQIQAYQVDGLSIDDPELQINRSLKFDGNEYPDSGQDAPPGPNNFPGPQTTSVLKALLTGANTKANCKHQHFDLSTDFKTITLSTILAGENRPRNIFVFDRE